MAKSNKSHISKYQRVKGGEKNEKTGVDWTKPELEDVCKLYIKLDGAHIHENNPEIHTLATQLGRTVRSVENQLLGFRKVATGDTGRKNYNRLIPLIWEQHNNTEKKVEPTNGLHFRISSALKDIIGRDLITDDYIAVFELVKNSFDAHARRVDIYFNDIEGSNASIVIKDTGKGMNKEDLENRWLFVAYSAKKEGTEDDDYRDRLYKNRPFAGAKGIGRFSCDRLGRELILETVKQGEPQKTHVLLTDWGKFEDDTKTEFIDIGIEYKIKKKNDHGLEHGTVLTISKLRSVWDRPKLQKLKDSLAKLINPNRGRGEQQFKIHIHVPDELGRDELEEDERNKVNGEVKNFIFEALGLKTTKIICSISEDGENVITELYDGGVRIYQITERNEYDLLDNISYTLYYLNQAAKYTFTNRMGVSSIEYGHVFLYKNNFRIYPYGEPGEDPLGIDARKTQGNRRFLGTRELIGQIEIFSDSDQLMETSSRGDGLIKTDTYRQLDDCFWVVLKRLEKYVVDVQKWGLSVDEDEGGQVKAGIAKMIANLSGSSSVVSFEYPENLLEILTNSQAKSATKVIKNLKRIALESADDSLLNEIEKVDKKFNEIRKAKEEAEADAERERKRAEQSEKERKERETENLFLKSLKSQDLDEIVSFMHSIGISASTIDNYLSSTYQRIHEKMDISPSELIKIIQTVSFENRKILSISRFATKANFTLYAEDTTVNLIAFVREYLLNIVAPLRQEDITITFDAPKKEFVKTIKPIEFSILIDNFISNSIRAKADNFHVSFFEDDGWHMSLKDNGRGIKDKEVDRIFDFGFTTTSGSGLGLFHVKQILSSIGAGIIVNNKQKKGVEFTINF